MQYDYDSSGRLEYMHTYQNGINWNAEKWEDITTGQGDVTRWRYHKPTGLLTAKEDAEGNSVSYTYESGGRLKTRRWARNNGNLVTTYYYDNKTGELLKTDYSDSTPDITFTYDRLGRTETVADALGKRTFAYNDSLQPESEIIPAPYNKTITRTYDSNAGTKGRPTGFFLPDYSVIYGYEPDTGRFRSLSHTLAGSQRTTTYYYVPKSDLIGRVETGSGALNDTATTYTYEPDRNLKTQVRNESFRAADTLVSQYDYTYDNLGRRTHATNTGSAFPQDAFSKYDYNSRSELTDSRRYLGTDITHIPVPVMIAVRSGLTMIRRIKNIGN